MLLWIAAFCECNDLEGMNTWLGKDNLLRLNQKETERLS